jgi:hypothetical protein
MVEELAVKKSHPISNDVKEIFTTYVLPSGSLMQTVPINFMVLFRAIRGKSAHLERAQRQMIRITEDVTSIRTLVEQSLLDESEAIWLELPST